MSSLSGIPIPGADPSRRCRNCRARLDGPFCARCGQEAREALVPFRRFAAEQLRDFFSLDTRFFRTLGWLVRRPGLLTNDYVEGRRVRWVPPLRLYLIVSVVFFFAFNLLPVDTSGIVQVETDDEVPPAASADSAETTPARGEESSSSGSWVQRRLAEGGRKMRQDETAFEEDLVDRIPGMMFFLLPVFALLLKLLYARRGILYAQHFVFSLHIHSAGFLAILVMLLLSAGGLPGLLQGVFGIRPVALPLAVLLSSWTYLYLAMRRVYRQPPIRTAAKLALLSALYLGTYLVALVATGFVTLLLF